MTNDNGVNEALAFAPAHALPPPTPTPTPAGHPSLLGLTVLDSVSAWWLTVGCLQDAEIKVRSAGEKKTKHNYQGFSVLGLK